MQNPIINEFGEKKWFDYQDKLHRDDDLPALISSLKNKYWYFHHKWHRTFGPSSEQNDGEIHWTWLDRNIEDE